MMKDSNIRSLIKGISWRIVGTIDTFVLAYIYFGDFLIAAPIAITEVFTKILLYYLHERLWNKVNWGRNPNKISNIRSITKGISWRVFGSIDTVLISYFYSGNTWSSFKVGGSEIITKIGLFYLHERLWAQIKWGRMIIVHQKKI